MQAFIVTHHSVAQTRETGENGDDEDHDVCQCIPVHRDSPRQPAADGVLLGGKIISLVVCSRHKSLSFLLLILFSCLPLRNFGSVGVRCVIGLGGNGVLGRCCR